MAEHLRKTVKRIDEAARVQEEVEHAETLRNARRAAKRARRSTTSARNLLAEIANALEG